MIRTHVETMYNFYRLSAAPDHVRMLHRQAYDIISNSYPGTAAFPHWWSKHHFPRRVRKPGQLPFWVGTVAVLQALRLEFISVLHT